MPTSCYEAFDSCCLKIRHRWLVATLSCLGLAIMYLQRTCIYLVIALGAKRLMHSTWDPHGHCHRHRLSALDKRKILYDWSGEDQSHILASFYIGYLITQIPGGVMALTFGTKRIVGISVVLSSLSTLMTPWALESSSMHVKATRFLLGIVQGPFIPALTQNGIHWAPREERSILNSVVYSGVALGLMFGNLLPSEIIHLGYQADMIFYIVAGVGVFWSVLWFAYATSSPVDHPLISLKEIKFIWRSVAYDSKAEGALVRLSEYGQNMNIVRFKWAALFLSKQNLIVALACFGFEWGFNMVSMELPFYAVDVLRMKVPKLAVITATPWVSMFFGSLLFGGLSHILLSQKIWGNTELRKTMGLISMPVFGICLLVASHEECATVLSASVFSLSGFYCGAAASGQWLTPSLLSPGYAGLVMAFANTVSSLAGLLVPLTVLSISPEKERTLSLWILQFSVATVVLTLCSLPYIFFTKTEVQT